jgi:hypothetical protein
MGMDWSLREGYSWAEDKEHCEEYGRMLQADPSKVSQRAKKRGLPQVKKKKVFIKNNSMKKFSWVHLVLAITMLKFKSSMKSMIVLLLAKWVSILKDKYVL